MCHVSCNQIHTKKNAWRGCPLSPLSFSGFKVDRRVQARLAGSRRPLSTILSGRKERHSAQSVPLAHSSIPQYGPAMRRFCPLPSSSQLPCRAFPFQLFLFPILSHIAGPFLSPSSTVWDHPGKEPILKGSVFKYLSNSAALSTEDLIQ